MSYLKLQTYRAAAVVPSDTTTIPHVDGVDKVSPCVLYVGVAGDLKVKTAGNDEITFKNAPVGFLPVQVKQVFATGTAASEIIALW
tara:strand:+ start:477 stop:734 length:258 start_codon:yes stop_codon:yes gene_type:complete